MGRNLNKAVVDSKKCARYNSHLRQSQSTGRKVHLSI